MAKDTAKKNVRSNAVRMQVFSLITLAINALCLFLAAWREGSILCFSSIAGLFFWAGQEYASLALLKHFAKPVYGPKGELLDCSDVSDPKELGIYSLAQDVLWVCWVVQLLCFLFHWGFVVLYLPVPVVGLCKLWCFVSPLFMGPKSTPGLENEFGPGPMSRSERRKVEVLRRKRKL
uniref:WGS project CAEQ00000000 data, annotated contig 430 n=1 Tax=Trypanosoma congolense (strain IL3000) TaxID=1068625 RepID=F9WFW8_TRYCI|nr:unnamed protein product [Trypanosoma congolense IL3000]